ncbi:tail fiber domain-containing protein [Saccharobesus litoralis]|uniref:tail fiber domain-containing protein n=1 Tax=Saccharobesus litoralis TaxID=2172099 RepID=UPI0018FFC839|nr:tail fiber domain-containing protein [Saccharobesus litoralis]
MQLKSNKLLKASGVAFLLTSNIVLADQQINDDLVVKGSQCVGVDCSLGENFNFDTIRLKENNLRIRFTDTSASSGFPTRDWEITANESANGGKNQFYIQNIDGGTSPFIIQDGALNNGLVISTLGRVGINTDTPQVNLHMLTGNSPTVRLEQDQSNGFTAQAWDVSGNETNFFIRDVTNNGLLPLRIRAGAPNASIYVAADGDIGFETTSPDGLLDIAHPSDINNHAILVSPLGYLGVNIDNSYLPRGLFDVQTTGGVSRLLATTDGKVGINMGTTDTPDGIFEVQDGSGNSEFIVDNSGNVGISTSSPAGPFEIKDAAGTNSYLLVNSSGNVTIANDLTVSGTLNASVNIDGFSTLSSSSVVTSGALTVTNDLTVNGSLNATLTGFTSLSASTVAVTGGLTTGGNVNVTGTIDASGKITSADDVCGQYGCLGDVLSSKALKDEIASVDVFDVLEKVSNLYLSRWTYKKDSDYIQHIGPYAEDFHAAFGLNGDKSDRIAVVDASGVAFASIQALNSKLKQKDQEIAELRAELAEIKQFISELKSK